MGCETETHRSCLRYDAELKCLVYDDNLGSSKPVKLPPPDISAVLNAACEFIIFANNIPVSTTDLTPVIAKVAGSSADLQWLSGPCTLRWTPPDGSAAQNFDLSEILNKAQDGVQFNPITCIFRYTDVNGESVQYDLATILNKSQDSWNFNPTTCEATYTNVAGQEQVFDLSAILNKAGTAGIGLNPANCVLTFTNTAGEDTELQLTSLFNKVQWDNNTCILTVPVPSGVRQFDLSEILNKIAVAYDPVTHSLVTNINGQTSTQVINCSTLSMEVVGSACRVTFTNAKGQSNSFDIPGLVATRDTDACTISLANGKNTPFVFREGLDPAGDFEVSLTADKNIELRVKDECYKVVLEDFVTDIQISDDNCFLKIFKWCSDPFDIDIFAALGLTKQDHGGFDIRVKDQICTFRPATLVPNPDNPNEFVFNNYFGQTATISLPTVSLDMDGASLAGSVLQLTFGGDGNPGSLNVDICAVVAQNCNATLTVNADGSLTHVSNSGIITQVPAPKAGNTSSITDNEDNSFTHSDGGGNDVSVFTGSVADDGAGGIDLEDNAGNKCKASAVIPVKKDGSNYAKGDQVPFFDLNELDDPDRGPMQDVRVEQQGLCFTYCDDSEEAVGNSHNCIRAFHNFGVNTLEADTPLGPMPGGVLCASVNRGKCPGFVDGTYQYSWSRRGAFTISDPEAQGRFTFLPEGSCDGGGSWTFVRTGGVDQFSATAVHPLNLAAPITDPVVLERAATTWGWFEQQYEDRFCCFMPAGTTDMCVRLNLIFNDLDPMLSMVQNAGDLDVRSNGFRNC